MASRDLVVRFIGDDRDLQRAFTSTERRAKQFDSRMTTVNQSLRGTLSGIGSRTSLLFGSGAFIGSAAATAGIREAVSNASDLNEQLSRTKVILGDASDEAIEWSRTTADAFGISQRAALSANAQFAGLFQTVGEGPKEAGRLSRSLVELAADLASLQNTSPEEALIALRSGLVGEAEPLRRFNIFLSEARVQQVAMANSGKENAKALTAQEKALARYEIIMRDSGPAQGNFAQTSGELANQTRILRAQMDDLSANLGQVFLPAVTGAVTGLNDFIDAMERGVISARNLRDAIKDIDFDIPEPPGWLSNFVLADDARDLLFGGGDSEDATVRPEAAGPGRGIGEDIARRAEEAAADAEKAEKAANRANRRREKAFNEFIKGQGLKLDRAGLTTTLNDDLAVLREMESAIKKRIAKSGRTFKLVQALTDVQAQIADTTAQQAADAAAKEEAAFEDMLGFLQLDLDRAAVTASFADDLAALDAIERALRERIAAEGRTLELERELFQVQQERRDLLRRQREAQQERRESRQFEQLGLTAEGEKRTPGVGALKRRLGTLREQIKGTPLDTQKTRDELDRIAKVLSGKFGQVGRDVRRAILEMFNEIASALETGRKQGPLTKTSGLNTNKFLEGLGLSEEEKRELRGRLSGLNSAGGSLGGTIGAPPRTSTTAGFGGQQGTILVESHTTINLDGEQVAKVVTRNQQRQRRRNPKQKRGPNRNR